VENRAHWSTRTLLMALVLSCLLPGIIGASALFVREYQSGRAQHEADTVLMARALAQAVDSRWVVVQTLAQALATSNVLRSGDLAAFHRRARELVAASGVGTSVVLTDERGRQLLNTLRPYGEPLPPHGNPELVAHVFATGRPVISDVYTGGVSRRPVLSVDVPVMEGERVAFDLSVGVPPDHFDAILRAQSLPSGWVGAIFDSSGTIVARTHEPERFVGGKGTLEFIERIRETGEGSLETVTREGIATVAAYSRSPSTKWSVGIGIPRDELERELRITIAAMGFGIAVLFVIGLGLAAAIGDRIARSVRALAAPAQALGTGQSVPAAHYQTREIAEVGRALEQAGQLLEQRTRSLEEANRLLRERGAELQRAHETNRRELERQVAERTLELSTANRELERLARRDALTGLQNRRSANERLRTEFVRLRRTGESYALLMIDIDHFKRVNDTFGHEIGDEVLREVAELVAHGLRASDFIARFGGEEFLAVLPATDEEGAASSAEKLREATAAHSFGRVERLTISVGVAVPLPTDVNEEEAVGRADAALYQAKRSGRDQVRRMAA
jgi:diguanylate cyclase (GGDEF)-like protein